MVHRTPTRDRPIRFHLPRFLTAYATPVIHLTARWLRPMTLGARTVIIDREDRVFLVKHSYIRGWHLPGGGVDVGETVAEAARREVREETGIELEEPLALHGVFFNRQASRRDHVAVFVSRHFRTPAILPGGGLEIVDRGFFPLSALPQDTARATRARIEEIRTGTPPAGEW